MGHKDGKRPAIVRVLLTPQSAQERLAGAEVLEFDEDDFQTYNSGIRCVTRRVGQAPTAVDYYPWHRVLKWEKRFLDAEGQEVVDAE